ncbi:MAG: hypothetical protein FWH35_04595 [Treponema sp.]|nr:hypothetical protein [Treponema sp.]
MPASGLQKNSKNLYVYDKTVKTRLSDYIHHIAHDCSSKGNHRLAIAAFSWAIAFNINNSYNSQSYNLGDRGDEYCKNKFYKEAFEDYNRALIINPGNYDALIGWHGIYSIFDDIRKYGAGSWWVKNGWQSFPDIANSIYYNEYEDIYRRLKFPCSGPFETWPGEDEDSFRVYTDIWRAIYYGASQKAVFYADRGMEMASACDWHGVLINFLAAIDADPFLEEAYTKAGKIIYREALAEIKKALYLDLELPLNLYFEDRNYEFHGAQRLLKISDSENFPDIVRQLIINLRYSENKNYLKSKK